VRIRPQATCGEPPLRRRQQLSRQKKSTLKPFTSRWVNGGGRRAGSSCDRHDAALEIAIRGHERAAIEDGSHRADPALALPRA